LYRGYTGHKIENRGIVWYTTRMSIRAYQPKEVVSMAARILVVDDEPNIVKGLKFSLEQDGYTVDTALDGMEGFQKASHGQYDLIILDVMLPGIDGIEVLTRLRQQSRVPVLMLTAKGEDMDKILGLEYGADDYMTKPFNILELKARVKAVLRRIQAPQEQQDDPDIIRSGEMTIHLGHRTVTIGDRSVNLTAKEFDLLALFASHPGKVFSREALLETVWKYDYLGDLRTVDVHIRRLREKIETNPSDPEYIFTKWGVGYYFTDQ
jgi:two-component system response regulator VicR